MNEPTQREHYRLRYPLSARPRLILNGAQYTVTEVSETGTRVLIEPGSTLPSDGDHEAVFCFLDGTRITTVASLIRVAEAEIVLNLSPPIPLSVIMAEQRFLLTRYPKESLK